MSRRRHGYTGEFHAEQSESASRPAQSGQQLAQPLGLDILNPRGRAVLGENAVDHIHRVETERPELRHGGFREPLAYHLWCSSAAIGPRTQFVTEADQ
ncbi:MAG TPA: hypothetical protein VGD67_23015 [Pseudonocardiaceae bacterium]